MKRFVKYGRERCLELHVLVLEGMMETESVCVKAEATETVVGGTVFLIANDGMTQILGMDADLVFAPRLQVEVDE